MNALSEYLLPLIFVIAIVVISLRKGIDKKKQEEMAKTTLPGRKSGEVISRWEPAPAPPVQKSTKKQQQPVSKRLRQSAGVSDEPSTPIVKDSEEIFLEPVLDIENTEDIKKAVIYTEIFKRQAF